MSGTEPKGPGLTRKHLRRIPQTEQLRRVMKVQREMVGMLGAWICRLRQVPVKYMAARHLWEWSEHVNTLRKRLTEMPGGKPDEPLESCLAGLIEECMFAADEAPFMEALYDALLPNVSEAYQDYVSHTHELPDRPTVVAVQDIIRALDEQIRFGMQQLNKFYPADPQAAALHPERGEWANHIRRLLAFVGGIHGTCSLEELNPLRKHAGEKYKFPAMQQRVKGSHFNYLFPIEGFEPESLLKSEVDFDRLSLGIWLFNEMDAAEYIPTILYEIKGMPWEFYYDVARHTWDEARHSEFGCKLLHLLGFAPEEFEVCAGTFMMSMSMKPYERYLAVTHWYEPGSFAVKPDFQERLAREVGDADGAVQLLKFDLADETLHVRLGQKWAPRLLEHAGDGRTVEQCVEAIKRQGMKTYAEQAAAFVRTMPSDQRLSVDAVKRRLKEWEASRGSDLVVL